MDRYYVALGDYTTAAGYRVHWIRSTQKTEQDPKTHTPKRVLEIHKFQPFLEKRHSQLKTYQEIAPVYLKNE